VRTDSLDEAGDDIRVVHRATRERRDRAVGEFVSRLLGERPFDKTLQRDRSRGWIDMLKSYHELRPMLLPKKPFAPRVERARAWP
jgi:hypothetical protein